ncbi:sperm-associated microtubule inner protein 10-like [Symsagittifera roscoffensis]|uniref:sperm-associated microtubule inner protein 10-like n=1 Tax=Symsagittifera roscoffensis TaxID=84072 RepID=UPI00307CBDA9
MKPDHKLIQSSFDRSLPKFSQSHPIIPRLYEPAWRHDMKNRELILQNADGSGIPNAHGPHNTTLYLEKRERLNEIEWQERVESKRPYVVRRCEALRPPLHDPFSRYKAGLMYRLDDPKDQTEVPVDPDCYCNRK